MNANAIQKLIPGSFVHVEKRKNRDMDRRIQKTRQAIFNAFEELLAEKRYEQLTVQDIIENVSSEGLPVPLP